MFDVLQFRKIAQLFCYLLLLLCHFVQPCETLVMNVLGSSPCLTLSIPHPSQQINQPTSLLSFLPGADIRTAYGPGRTLCVNKGVARDQYILDIWANRAAYNSILGPLSGV